MKRAIRQIVHDDCEYATMDSPRGSMPSAETPWRDMPHPMGRVNWISLLTMVWMDPLMRRGAERTLQEDDVWQLSPQDTAAKLHDRFRVHWMREEGSGDPSFARALWRTLKVQSCVATAICGFYSALMLVQPTVIKSLVEYLQAPEDLPPRTTLGISSGYALAGLLALSSFLAVTMNDFGQFLTSNLGVNAKSIVMDCVYLKSLKLSGHSRHDLSSGEIVTLAAVDSERVYQGYLGGPWVLVAPLTLLIMFVLVGIDMGIIVGLVGGTTTVAILYGGYVSSKAVGDLRRETTTVQAERVKLTNEILHGIRVVKLYAWETYMEERIKTIRAKELALLRSYQYQRVLNTVVLSIAPVFSLALCLAVYIAQGNELTTPLAFTILAYMNVARIPYSIYSSSVMCASEAVASCARVGCHSG
ncbi:hypothetical protein H310_14572 [Aphanomyces invadans]|uniref:ABC transmembrane type-1 domain-containing protein n=1 Tax=Aphanomyces invadans TaxID=157072 RepID=A0A024T9F4_9STRA|nr:hypothetical protein H310_14572 [Aphanomyces invadans]ETV90678.1 hypothetical protein H310_14572 [Aphanomyces invadans]|eukprot:XP_008880675.1 hypothetical protein H310_14572 [Aphanomyces invadans]